MDEEQLRKILGEFAGEITKQFESLRREISQISARLETLDQIAHI